MLIRVTGIEPVPHAWEAHVLPLNYTRWTLFADGINLKTQQNQGDLQLLIFLKQFGKKGKKDLLDHRRSGCILLECAGIA
jgi:hypothetical protein